MSPPRNASSARARLTRQSSLTNEAPLVTAAPAPTRRPLLRRQRSADDDRPITQLLHSALKVTASALGPGIIGLQPPPPPPPKPLHKPGPLRPVRVAWAELRAGGKEASLPSPKPPPPPQQPTCLPALARANLDIFLAHSGLARCLANIDLGQQHSAKGVDSVKVSPREMLVKVSPREAPIKAALTPIPRTPTLAASRRVNFKNTSRHTNRSFTESPEPQKLIAPEAKGARILSAPSYRTAPILTPSRPMLRSLARRSPLNSSFESETSTDNRVKSAPSRRRLQSAGRSGKRGVGRKGDETSDDEDSYDPPPAILTAPKPVLPTTCNAAIGVARPGRRGLRMGAEIVTMVSLISPANSSDSESEATTPGAHQVAPVPGAEAAPAWQDKEDDADTGKGRAPPHPTIVCARKINKSVSFQSRSSLPELLRRASIQLTKTESEESVAIESKEIESEAKTDTTLQTAAPKKTEKPPAVVPPASAAGIMKAPDLRRKLVRSKALVRQNSKTEPESKTSKDVSSDSQSVSSVDSVIKKEPDKHQYVTNSSPPISISKPLSAPLASAEEMDFAFTEGSPKFESPKEQECWHLYRKMCEKGLTVSFDTVLRGMLTPTEYRLRKGALLSSC